MIPKAFTLKQLHNKKAVDYYNRSRDKSGVATKTMAQCRDEVIEDFGIEELDRFNNRLKGYWNCLFDAGNIVVWTDGTKDIKRECSECGQLCKYPVHDEAYREN